MANFEAQVTFLDWDGKDTSRTYHLQAVDRAGALAKLQGLVEAADNIIDGQITAVSLKDNLDISAWNIKQAPNIKADKEVKVLFEGKVAGNFNFRHTLPTFSKEAYTIQGGDVPLDDPDIYAYAETALVLNGFTDYRYADIISINAAKEQIG